MTRLPALVRPALVVLAILVLLLALVWLAQRRLVYLPDRSGVQGRYVQAADHHQQARGPWAPSPQLGRFHASSRGGGQRVDAGGTAVGGDLLTTWHRQHVPDPPLLQAGRSVRWIPCTCATTATSCYGSAPALASATATWAQQTATPVPEPVRIIE